MNQDQTNSLNAKLDALKAELEDIEGVGKDVLLRFHGAIDAATAEVRAAASVADAGHDLNDTLVAATGSPEDHPREQGAVHPTVAEQKSEEFEANAPTGTVVQNPERRTGDADTVEPELPAGDPVHGKDQLETEQLDPSVGETPSGVVPEQKPV